MIGIQQTLFESEKHHYCHWCGRRIKHPGLGSGCLKKRKQIIQEKISIVMKSIVESKFDGKRLNKLKLELDELFAQLKNVPNIENI
jgi:hypothetical protein